MKRFEGMKLLILGGAYQHKRLVELAKSMGIITYVVDYLPLQNAPAKQISDYHFEINITDYDAIVTLCKKEHIDGVLSTNLDACQKPYQKICEILNFPCFGNEYQFSVYTDKNIFKQFCLSHGLDVIPRYDEKYFKSPEVCLKNVDFPVLVKPAMSRGSRGQTICETYNEVKAAIDFAIKESSNGKVVIEKYMGNTNDFSFAPLTINGVTYVERTSDRFLGSGKMNKSAILSLQPSIHSDSFVKNVKPKVGKMIKDLGIFVAPMMMQGFFIDDKVYFYDPGLRFGGFEYERLYESVNGFDPRELLIEYALTGKVTNTCLIEKLNDAYRMNGKRVAILYIPILPGIIKEIQGVNEIKNHKNVINLNQNYFEGDSVGEFYNVKQRFCEINIVCENDNQLKTVIDWIYQTLKILNNEGKNMIFSRFDTRLLINRS